MKLQKITLFAFTVLLIAACTKSSKDNEGVTSYTCTCVYAQTPPLWDTMSVYKYTGISKDSATTRCHAANAILLATPDVRATDSSCRLQ